ncbi:MAG: hypothetical protein O3A46_07865 [Candidatus Poribacteria bacterium]|nr:hypothetical protein [Candidatus Poribacteria bacterium]
MGMVNPSRFDTSALIDALDAKRRDRELSWRTVAVEMGGIAPATLTRAKDGGVMESDGVLGMCRWLGRPPEWFSLTNRHLAGDAWTTEPPESGHLRVHTRALYDAVNERRQVGGQTWKQVAAEIGVGESQVTNLSKGGRIGIHQLMAVLLYLERNVESCLRIADR